MDYIKDNGIMEKLPFWKFGGKSSSAEKYLFENENGSGQMLLYNVLPGLKLAVTELNGSTMNFYHPAVSGVMQINYCLNGRMGWVMQGGRSIYLGQGDVSFHMMLHRIGHNLAFGALQQHCTVCGFKYGCAAFC